MRNFAHINAATIDEAVAALRQYGKRASIIAGGTDRGGLFGIDFLYDAEVKLLSGE